MESVSLKLLVPIEPRQIRRVGESASSADHRFLVFHQFGSKVT